MVTGNVWVPLGAMPSAVTELSGLGYKVTTFTPRSYSQDLNHDHRNTGFVSAKLHFEWFNSLRHRDDILHHTSGPALDQVMAWCLMAPSRYVIQCCIKYYQLDPWEQTFMKFHLRYNTFHSVKCIWKYCLHSGSHFVVASICQQDSLVQQGLFCYISSW